MIHITITYGLNPVYIHIEFTINAERNIKARIGEEKGKTHKRTYPLF